MSYELNRRGFLKSSALAFAGLSGVGSVNEDYAVDCKAPTGPPEPSAPPREFNYSVHPLRWSVKARDDTYCELLLASFRYLERQ